MTRTARIAAGLVLIAGALELGRNAIADHRAMPAWHIIVGTWAIALAVGLVGSVIPDRGHRHHTASYVIPCTGAALLMPLTIHLVVFRACGCLDAFNEWTSLSLLFVGVAHVVFAAMVGARAAAIVEGREPPTVRSICVATLTMSAVPGAIVILPIPIVALTMLPIGPLLHWMNRLPKAPALPTAIAKVAA